MTKFRAFAIHLAISLAIFAVLAWLVVFKWYPEFFFHTDGGWRGLRIIVFVDLVLGPALTLVVYKAGKKGLKGDLALIGLLQFACLFAGTWVVYSERPLAIVYNDSRFSILSADDFRTEGLPIPDLSTLPGDYPKWVMVEIPQGIQAEADFRSRLFKAGRTISTYTEGYKAFEFRHEQVVGAPRDRAALFDQDNRAQALNAWLAEQNRPVDNFLFYNVASRFTYGALVFDKVTGEQVGVIDFTD